MIILKCLRVKKWVKKSIETGQTVMNSVISRFYRFHLLIKDHYLDKIYLGTSQYYIWDHFQWSMIFLKYPRHQNVLRRTQLGPFRSLFGPILVSRVSQIDYKATKLVENESLWCPTTVSIKTMILIEWTKPLEP